MEKTIYSKYSNERAEQFCIRTDIVLTEEGKQVYKHALKAAGLAHIGHIMQAYRQLRQAYGAGAKEKTGICFCDCETAGQSVRFPFVKGHTLGDVVEEAVKRMDRTSVERIIREYIRRIREYGGNQPFEQTPEFKLVFGEVSLEIGLPCAMVSDIDMIFSNIILSDGAAWEQDTIWNVIDYEWTFDFPVPKDFILYRALYFAYYQSLNDTAWSLAELFGMAGITEAQIRVFSRMEEHFQAYLGRGALPVRNMQRKIGTRIHTLMEADDGDTAGAGAPIRESDWIKVRKLMYHIDRQEYQDGSMICCGWAFARAKDGRYLPVDICVKDSAGRGVPAELHRLERRDVAETLRIRGVTEPIWGFDLVWIAPATKDWQIHFSLGKCSKVYETSSSIKG